MRQFQQITTCLALTLASALTWAGPPVDSGVLDQTFGSSGKVILNAAEANATGTNLTATDVAVQSNGKIIVAGYADSDCVLARLNPNGSLDTSFGGTNGFSPGFAGYGLCSFTGIAVRPDDRIVTVANQPDGVAVVSQFTANGLPDYGNFGSNAATFINPLSGDSTNAARVILESNGTIDVAGTYYANQSGFNSNEFLFVQISADGKTVQPLFQYLFSSGPDADDHAQDLGIDSQGRYVVVGYHRGAAGNYDFAAIRIRHDLYDVDNTFGSAGQTTVDFGDNGDYANALTLTPTGYIALGGQANGQAAMALLDPNGNLNTYFSGGLLYGKIHLRLRHRRRQRHHHQADSRRLRHQVSAAARGRIGQAKLRERSRRRSWTDVRHRTAGPSRHVFQFLPRQRLQRPWRRRCVFQYQAERNRFVSHYQQRPIRRVRERQADYGRRHAGHGHGHRPPRTVRWHFQERLRQPFPVNRQESAMSIIRTHCIPRRRRLATSIAAAFALAAFAPACFANYDNVLNCNDTGAGSLRATIAGAGSGDTVILNPVTMQCSAITLGSGEIAVPQSDLTVKYNGDNSNRFVLSGNNHRIFHHSGTGKLTLQRLSLQFGKATDADAIYIQTGKYKSKAVLGGCVYSAGVVDLENSQVKYCSVASSTIGIGGGIGAMKGLIINNSILRDNAVTAFVSPTYGSYALCGGAFAGVPGLGGGYGYIDASYSTIRDNAVGGSGGGLCIIGPYGASGPQSTIQNSTISGNSANDSSAISSGGLLSIANSTISGNTATSTAYTASAIFAAKTLTLRNSTVAFNHAANGAAIWFNNIKYRSNAHYAVDFESSIIANNTSSGTESDVYSRVDPSRALTIAGANNIVMSTSAGAPLPGDTLMRDPLLLPLANNGGPTLTHAFRDGSPAFGHGNNSGNFSTDQRGAGFARLVNGAVDIGAYEVQVREVIFANGFD